MLNSYLPQVFLADPETLHAVELPSLPGAAKYMIDFSIMRQIRVDNPSRRRPVQRFDNVIHSAMSQQQQQPPTASKLTQSAILLGITDDDDGSVAAQQPAPVQPAAPQQVI